MQQSPTGDTVPVDLRAGEPDGAWLLFVESHNARGSLSWTLQAPPNSPADTKVFHLQSHAPLNLDALTELLARTIVHDFEDKVVVVRKGKSPALVPSEPLHPRLFQASVMDGNLPFAPEAFDCIFADEAASRLLAHHPALQHTTLQFTRELPLAETQWEQDTRFILLMPVSSSPVDGELEGAVDPRKLPLLQRGCWIELPDELLSGAHTGLEKLDERTKQHLSRCARVITDRQVGISLSGGGAWGFYHYVLLEELTRRKVPIDVITGSSIGAVMGAYYGVRGLGGLECFRDRCTRGEISMYTWLSMISTALLEDVFKEDLGDAQLDQLSTRVHPVAMNLSTGEATVFTRGPLALATRASSSAPGLWGPTLLKPCRHFVDGAAAHNLPALWLPHLGADLTFSCNCYPAQSRPYHQLIPGDLGRVLKVLNPVERLLDLISSGNGLLHANGELGSLVSTRSFHKSPSEDPLRQATAFHRADEIICHARNDSVFNETLNQFVNDWEKLRASS
ncbi:patatin-like phospholipase family protein [Hyalangium versicolor]|uniref:patatin-like phospholipase family protein n=1 Tax=Hyalangium versicolor TaxID=2861190 RepID=UPI001CCB0BB7|nr:patatin-like phospholipase family protein [Hyalangium versicolor]